MCHFKMHLMRRFVYAYAELKSETSMRLKAKAGYGRVTGDIHIEGVYQRLFLTFGISQISLYRQDKTAIDVQVM